jgi:hypothetical protein
MSEEAAGPAGVDAAVALEWLDRLWVALSVCALAVAVLIALATALSVPVPEAAPTLFLGLGTLALPFMAATWLARRYL